mgnify:CR=1 FL=1
MKAYLLLLGANSCHGEDEFQGIFTNIITLKGAYDTLLRGKGTEYDSYLKPKIYEFDLDSADTYERLLSDIQINNLIGRK